MVALARGRGVGPAHGVLGVERSRWPASGDETQTGYGFSVGAHVRRPRRRPRPRRWRPSGRRGCSARRQPASRRLPVVFDPLVTASLLGLLGSALSGEAVLKGRSMFVGPRRREDRRAASVTLVDDPTIPRRSAPRPTTARACRPGAVALVVDGTLLGLPPQRVHRAPDADARRPAPRCGASSRRPASAPGRCTSRPGRRPPAEILASVPEALYVQSVSRPALGHEPGERRLLGRRRGADGARRRVRRAGARDHDRVDAAAHAARRRRGRRRPHLAPGGPRASPCSSPT